MINNKRIGIDARMIEMSGIGTYIQHLMRQGIYDYAVGREELIRKYDKDVKIIPFDAPIYKAKEQLLFPVKAIKSAGIDLMHFPHYNVPITYRGRYVVTIHDLTHLIFPEYLGSKIKYYYAKFLMGRAAKNAEHIFTVSNNSKKDIIRFFGVPDGKITVTYNAVDDDFRVKDKAEIDYLYEKYNIPRDKKLLLFVGNLKPHKNLGTLLHALKNLHRDDVMLILVGKAFKNLDLEKQEEEMGIREKVIHTGLVSKEELVDLYNLADVFVFSSLYEGFGIPLLEAMACGTPVIAANNSSIPEVVGDAALLVDGKSAEQISSAVEMLMKSTKMADEFIKKGFIRCNSFSWKNTVFTIWKNFEIATY